MRAKRPRSPLSSGNPLFIPEIGTNAANLIMAFGKFGVDGNRPIHAEFAAAYGLLNNVAPMILAHQGTDTMTTVRMVQFDPPRQIKLDNGTLSFTYTGRITPLAPQAKSGMVASPPPRQPGTEPEEPLHHWKRPQFLFLPAPMSIILARRHARWLCSEQTRASQCGTRRGTDREVRGRKVGAYPLDRRR